MRAKWTEADLWGILGAAMVCGGYCQMTVLDALFYLTQCPTWLEVGGMHGDRPGHVVSCFRLIPFGVGCRHKGNVHVSLKPSKIESTMTSTWFLEGLDAIAFS